MGLARLRVGERDAGEVSPPQISAREVSTLKSTVSESGLCEAHIAEVELSRAEIGDVRVMELSPLHRDIPPHAPAHLKPREVKAIKHNLTRLHVVERSACELKGAQIELMKLSALKDQLAGRSYVK